MQDEASGLRYTNVKLLHRTLMNELNALQGAAVAGQKQSILEVMNSVLSSMDQSSILSKLVFLNHHGVWYYSITCYVYIAVV